MTQLENDKDQAKKKRERLLALSYRLITSLNDNNLAQFIALVGSRYMIREGGQLAVLKAVYYRSLDSRDDE
jgi:ribosomal protein L17